MKTNAANLLLVVLGVSVTLWLALLGIPAMLEIWMSSWIVQ